VTLCPVRDASSGELIKSHSHPQSDPTCITYTFQNGRTSLFVGTADGKVGMRVMRMMMMMMIKMWRV
jgi:oxalate decarboxylase/phosphoglucose isomerase-like protein (cupin superfamily)